MSCTGEEEGGWVCPCVEGALILWEGGGGDKKNLKKGSDDAIWQWAFTAPQICTNSTTQKYIIKSKVEENNSPFFVNVVLNRFCCFLVFPVISYNSLAHIPTTTTCVSALWEHRAGAGGVEMRRYWVDILDMKAWCQPRGTKGNHRKPEIFWAFMCWQMAMKTNAQIWFFKRKATLKWKEKLPSSSVLPSNKMLIFFQCTTL